MSVLGRIMFAIDMYRGNLEFKKDLARQQNKANNNSSQKKSSKQAVHKKTTDSHRTNSAETDKHEKQENEHSSTAAIETGYCFDEEVFLHERMWKRAEQIRLNDFDAEGYNSYGYDCFNYNRQGIDSAGKKRADYCEKYGYLLAAVQEAQKRLKRKEYSDALSWSRRIFEDVLNVLLAHKEGENSKEYNRIIDKQIACQEYGLLGNDSKFIEDLHKVRKTCNENEHDITYADTVSHNKVHAVVMTVKKLVEWMAQQLDLYSS